MKMVDLKLPKKTKKEMTEMTVIHEEAERDRWPYGMQLHFESEQVNKLPYLKKLKVGQKVIVEGIGEVTSIRMNEKKDGKEDYSVDIQLQEVGCEGKGKMTYESMGEAINRAKENHRT